MCNGAPALNLKQARAHTEQRRRPTSTLALGSDAPEDGHAGLVADLGALARGAALQVPRKVHPRGPA